MIELVRDLRVINVLAKFENDPWKIMDVRVLTGLVCPATRPPTRPLRVRQYPGTLKGCGVKTSNALWTVVCKMLAILFRRQFASHSIPKWLKQVDLGIW